MDVLPADPGRDASFEALALPYLDAVHRFARALTRSGLDPEADADDLVQETFLRAYRGWHTFRHGADCRRWLFTICHHTHLRLRPRRLHVRLDEGDADARDAVLLHAQTVREGTEELLTRLILGPALRAALRALPEHYSSVVLLVDGEGYRYDEAAEVLGVPVGTVRSRLFRARRLLQERLLDHAHDLGLTPPAATHPHA